jgi:hypothetical protein
VVVDIDASAIITNDERFFSAVGIADGEMANV